MNESRIGKRLLTLIQGEAPTGATARRGFLTAVAAGLGARILGAQQRSQAEQPPADDTFSYRRNWRRWGANDSKGAVNLITAQKRVEAAGLVRTGRVVSLSRPFTPEQQYIRMGNSGHSVVDYYGFEYHGVLVTHVDALSHVWDENGMWNGRDPAKEIDTHGRTLAISPLSAVASLPAACCWTYPDIATRNNG